MLPAQGSGRDGGQSRRVWGRPNQRPGVSAGLGGEAGQQGGERGGGGSRDVNGVKRSAPPKGGDNVKETTSS